MKRYLFYIDSSRGTERVFYQPYGWEQAGWQMVRSELYGGVFRKFVVASLEFVKDGKAILKALFESEGTECEADFIVKRFDPATHYYVECFRGMINFATYERTETSIRVNIEDSAFEATIKTREDVPVNLIKTTTVDGEAITPFPNEGVLVKLPSRVDGIIGEFSVDTMTAYSGNHSIPYVKSVGEDAGYHSVDTPANYNSILGSIFVASDACVLWVSGSLNVVVNATVVVSVLITRYNSSNVLQETISLFSQLIDPSFEINITWAYQELTLADGDYVNVTLVYAGTPGATTGQYTATLSCLKDPVEFPEESIYAVLYHEAFTRVLQSITGVYEPLYSELIGRTDSEVQSYAADGALSLGVVLNGKHLRGFTLSESPLTVTLKDLFATIKAIWNVGLGIESGKVRIEPLSYFFDDAIVLTLENCREINESVDANRIHNMVSVGFGKFEATGTKKGIYEFNTKITYADIIKTVKSELSLIAPYRADDSGMMQARLKPKATYPTEDVNTDEDNFVLSVVRDGADIIAKTIEGYDSVTGSSNDLGVMNLDYSPARSVRRHGWVLRSFLEKYLTSYLVYSKQDKLCRLVSDKTGEDPITETADILVSTLDAPRFEAIKYTFESPLTTDDLTTLEATTGGVPNAYGIVKFRQNENDTYKYGWIISINVQDEGQKTVGKFELIKVNVNFLPA